MDKSKKLIIVFVLLVLFLIDYGMYIFYFKDNFEVINDKRQTYTITNKKLNNIKSEEQQLNKLQKDNEKLKEEAKSFDEKIPKYIDTPQVAYDFYVSCQKYNVKGDTLAFELKDAGKTDSTLSNNINNGTSDVESNNDQGANVTNNISNGVNSNGNTSYVKLTITLNVSGSKINMDKYIDNLGTITSRKLNINSITLSSENESTDSTAESNIKAEIIFYQYIQKNSNDFDANKQYDFYDKTIDLNNIMDMFK